MKICFFDIDGTLIATGGAGQRAFAQVFREVFGIDKISADVSFAGRSDRAIAMDLLELHGLGKTPENWDTFRREYVARLPASLAACKGCVLPGVEELVAELDEAGGIHAGLLTGNIVAGAEAKLSHYDLWRYFPFGGFGDEHDDRADIARAAVAAAREHLGPSSNGDDRIVVIGDTIHDIRCARAIGALAVAVPTGFMSMDDLRREEPDLALETLEDCRELVDWLKA